MNGIYTVKQVNSYIKNMFTQDFMLNRIYVKGEISNCKYHPSGHIYFSLKDESGTIACVMFAGSRAGLSFTLKNGQRVIAFGSVSVYERDANISFMQEKSSWTEQENSMKSSRRLSGNFVKWGCFQTNISSEFLPM